MAMNAVARFQDLLASLQEGVRFLVGYVEGQKGYTTQDVRSGAARLEQVCRELERLALNDPLAHIGRASALSTARASIARARERMAALVPVG
jgi:hypothetical protein